MTRADERSPEVRVLDPDAAQTAGSKLWPGRFIEDEDGVVIDTAGTIPWPPIDPVVMGKVTVAMDAVAENGDAAIPLLTDAVRSNDPTIDPGLAFRIVPFALEDSASTFQRAGKPASKVERLARSATHADRVLKHAPVRPRSRERRERRPTRRAGSRSGSRGDPHEEDPDPELAPPSSRDSGLSASPEVV